MASSGPNYNSDAETQSNLSFKTCSNSEGEVSDDEEEEHFLSNTTLLHTSDFKIPMEYFIIYIFRMSFVFINSIIPWTYNNPLNLEHVQAIKAALRLKPILTGVFTIIELDNKMVYLLDGHHRHQAIFELYRDGELEQPIEIVAHCYRSDKINSKRTVELFQNLNHTKPYNIAPPVVQTTIMVIDFLERKYPGIIKDTRVRTHYPFIHKKTLNEILHHRLDSLDDFSYDSIINSIPDINRYYEINSREIVEKQKRSWESVNTKLERTGCYLGLVPIKKWVDEITRDVEYR